jgi:branched-chain amino acid transport system ATP-binding protein
VGLIDVQHLRVRYRNGALGTRDVSFTVGQGQVITLVGPNGAGKTSAVRAVSGFLRTEGGRSIAGTVSFQGQSITNVEPSVASRMGIAIVPERRKVFPTLTVRENLDSLAHRPSRAQRRQRLESVFALFPFLPERLNEAAGRLSGGQQQMLALARSLLTEPKVLIIDEMTQGLHHSLRPALADAIAAISARGTAIILVEENTGFALQVSHYCYLVGGGVVRNEGPSSLFVGSELLAAGYVDAEAANE